MLDHEQVSAAGAGGELCVRGAERVGCCPLLPGSGVPHLYYCDPIEGLDPLGNEVTPTTCVDVTAVVDRKAEMLACHASQREWLRRITGWTST